MLHSKARIPLLLVVALVAHAPLLLKLAINAPRLGVRSRPANGHANGNDAVEPNAAIDIAPHAAAADDDSPVALDLKAACKHSDKCKLALDEHEPALSERASSLEDVKKRALVSKTEADRLGLEEKKYKDIDQRLTLELLENDEHLKFAAAKVREYIPNEARDTAVVMHQEKLYDDTKARHDELMNHHICVSSLWRNFVLAGTIEVTQNLQTGT